MAEAKVAGRPAALRTSDLQADADDDDVDRRIASPAPCSISARSCWRWWLIAAASGPNPYARVQWFMGSWIGRLILFGCTWALMHHLLGGIRHLIWDIGYGFGPSEREWLTRAAWSARWWITVLTWVVGLW